VLRLPIASGHIMPPNHPLRASAKPPQTEGRIGFGDQSATGPLFPMGCAGGLRIVDGTPAPDRKEQHRVGRRERALRSFAPAN